MATKRLTGRQLRRLVEQTVDEGPPDLLPQGAAGRIDGLLRNAKSTVAAAADDLDRLGDKEGAKALDRAAGIIRDVMLARAEEGR